MFRHPFRQSKPESITISRIRIYTYFKNSMVIDVLSSYLWAINELHGIGYYEMWKKNATGLNGVLLYYLLCGLYRRKERGAVALSQCLIRSLHKIPTQSKASHHLVLLIYSHEQNELVYVPISRPCVEVQVEQNYLRKHDMTYYRTRFHYLVI